MSQPRQKFVIVSNRLPISVSKIEGKLVFTPSPGGLATAISSLDKADYLWIGWPGISADELTPTDKASLPAHCVLRAVCQSF